MTTNDNNRDETNTPTFTSEQEVWVKARIAGNPIPDRDGEIKIYTTNSWDNYGEHYVLSSEIRTTEQIMQEYGASSPQHKAIKYEYTMTLNGDFAIYQVIKYTATETEAMKELNRLNREASHFAKETPQNAVLPDQNAELTDQNAECWVRAKYIEKNDFGNLIELNDGSLNKRTHIQDSDLHFTKPQTQEIIFTEHDFANTLKEGDTVKLVERWGRTPYNLGSRIAEGFELNGIYIVTKGEDGEFYVRITNGNKNYFVPFIFLDLVEPAPEPAPRFKINEDTVYYYIIDAEKRYSAIYSKRCYTLEEVQAECERLKQKENNE